MASEVSDSLSAALLGAGGAGIVVIIAAADGADDSLDSWESYAVAVGSVSLLVVSLTLLAFKFSAEALSDGDFRYLLADAGSMAVQYGFPERLCEPMQVTRRSSHHDRLIRHDRHLHLTTSSSSLPAGGGGGELRA